MADYRRIVSYLYQYKNGKRGENVGFVRVQKAQDRLKIVLNVKDKNQAEDIMLRLYFYIQKNGKLNGIFVDNIVLKGGNCEYKRAFFEREIFKNHETLDDMHGMMIYYNQEMSYGTEWGDKKIEVNQFVLEDKRTKQEKKKREERQEEPSKAEDRKNINFVKKKEEDEKKSLEREKISNQNETYQKTEKSIEKEKTIENSNESSKDNIVNEKKEEKKREVEVSASMIHMQEQRKRDEIEIMLADYPKIDDIDSEDLNDCVKIMPRDIGKMDTKNWWLRSNRLLLYRFEQYHYLLLGRRKTQDGSWQRVIGIPGVFDSKERYLASLFQFYCFIPTENRKYRTGSFGYWVTPIK